MVLLFEDRDTSYPSKLLRWDRRPACHPAGPILKSCVSAYQSIQEEFLTRIKIKGFLDIRTAIGGSGEVELELLDPTIRKALLHLSEMYGEALRDLIFEPSTTSVRSINIILVNGRHYRHFADGLDAKLSEGDLLAVFPPVAGG
jgi:MoaD family protein